MVVVWSLLAVQPILLVRACGGALSGCFRSARKRIGARSGPRARHARAARRPWRRRRELKRRAERSRRASRDLRAPAARDAARERERVAHPGQPLAWTPSTSTHTLPSPRHDPHAPVLGGAPAWVFARRWRALVVASMASTATPVERTPSSPHDAVAASEGQKDAATNGK